MSSRRLAVACGPFEARGTGAREGREWDWRPAAGDHDVGRRARVRRGACGVGARRCCRISAWRSYRIRSDKRSDGRQVLRYSTTIVNVGAGAFEVHGARTGPSEMNASAADLRRDRQVPRVVTPGTMVFGGDGHNHWHVNNLATSELFALNGNRGRDERQAGLLFWDNIEYRLTLPGAPQSALYVRPPAAGRWTAARWRWVSRSVGVTNTRDPARPVHRHHQRKPGPLPAPGHGGRPELVRRDQRGQQCDLGRSPAAQAGPAADPRLRPCCMITNTNHHHEGRSPTMLTTKKFAALIAALALAGATAPMAIAGLRPGGKGGATRATATRARPIRRTTATRATRAATTTAATEPRQSLTPPHRGPALRALGG